VKLATIGAGRIIHFHLPALVAAGFDLAAIAASPGSQNAREVARSYNIPKTFDSAPDLLKCIRDYDALLIASSSESLLKYLLEVKSLGIPILVEKPVFLGSSEFDHLNTQFLDNSRVMVGYNRRFYPSVKALSHLIESTGNGVLNVSVPELSGTPEFNIHDVEKCLRVNTVHILDLLFHLMPLKDFKSHIFVKKYPVPPLGIVILFQSEQFLVNVSLTFGAPGNYKFEYRSGNELATLEPVEQFKLFKGMEITEPTTINPVRVYAPKRVNHTVEAVNSSFKPGFLEQATHFFRLASGGDVSGHATIRDAANVSQFVEKLIIEIHDQS
jgi:predicted dehydrogenase